MDRRALCRGLALASGGYLLRPAGVTAQPPEYFRWEAIGDRAWVAHGGGGNTLLIESGGAAALIDCKLDGLGAALRREASERIARLELVVNTHHHRDHTGGTVAFRGELPVHAQQRCVGRRLREAATLKDSLAEGVPARLRERLISRAATPGAGAALEADLETLAARIGSMDLQSFAPSDGFATEAELRLGTESLELRHEGRAHTDNDAWVRIPGRNLVHAGDLVFVGMHPVIDVDAGATTAGWQATLLAIESSTDEGTIVVPGHGPVGDRGALRTQWEYFEQARDAVAAAIAEGRSRDEIVAMRPASFDGIPEARAGRTLGILYDEIS